MFSHAVHSVFCWWSPSLSPRVYCPWFSSWCFPVLGFIFRSFTHFEFIFIWCETVVKFHPFAGSCPVYPIPLTEGLSIPHHIFLPPAHRLMDRVSMVLCLGASFFSGIDVSVFVLGLYCFAFCSFCWYSLKARSVISPALLFFLQLGLALLSHLCFHTNVWIIRSSSVENSMGIFIGVIEPVCCFE